MFNNMNHECIRRGTLILIISMLGPWLTPAAAGQPNGGETPQEVFKAAQAAGTKNDFSTLARLTAPSERPMLALGIDMTVGMFLEFYEGENAAELKKKYQEIQNKYEIKPGNEDEGEKLKIDQGTSQEVIEEHMRKRAEQLYGHVDVADYVPDLMSIVINMPEMAGESFFPQEELSDLNIDGNHATGKAGEKTISFVREDDRWYLTADALE